MGGTVDNLMQLEQSWSRDPAYAPWNQPHLCPCCGYCPVCGRKNSPAPSYPFWSPYHPLYIGDPPGWTEWNKVWCCTVTANDSGTVNANYN